jgi:hypothetical protein
MDDSFSFGQPPKKRRGRVSARPRHAAPARSPSEPSAGRVRPSHARKGSFEWTRLVLGVVALAVIAVLVWGFLHFMGSAGNAAATGEAQAIDRAQDVQAQLTGTSAIQAVEGLYAQSGSFDAITPDALKSFEPTFAYTDGESTEPNTVSVKSTGQGVGLAVRSASGTCLYARVAAAGVTYDAGTTCTGDAALEASNPSWPTPS